MWPLLNNLIKFILFPWNGIVSPYHRLINWLYQCSICAKSCCWVAAVCTTLFCLVMKISLIGTYLHQWYCSFFVSLKPIWFPVCGKLRFLCKSWAIDFPLDLKRLQNLLVFCTEVVLWRMQIFLGIQSLIVEILVLPVLRKHLYF